MDSTLSMNLQAEETVVGGILMAGSYGVGIEVYKRSADVGLEARHFYRRSNGAMYRLFGEMTNGGIQIDPLTTQHAILAQVDDAVGAFASLIHVDEGKLLSRLVELGEVAPAFSNIEHHARIVKLCAEEREGS